MIILRARVQIKSLQLLIIHPAIITFCLSVIATLKYDLNFLVVLVVKSKAIGRKKKNYVGSDDQGDIYSATECQLLSY